MDYKDAEGIVFRIRQFDHLLLSYDLLDEGCPDVVGNAFVLGLP